MSYLDLPEDIRSAPLTEGAIRADVIDLLLDIEERRRGALAVMICDDLDHGLQPLVIDEVGIGEHPEPLAEMFDHLLPMVGHDQGAVLVGRGRDGSAVPTDDDRDWHQVAIDACARTGVRLLGFYVATPVGVCELPAPLAATS
jgi:hypothetical protein